MYFNFKIFISSSLLSSHQNNDCLPTYSTHQTTNYSNIILQSSPFGVGWFQNFHYVSFIELKKKKSNKWFDEWIMKFENYVCYWIKLLIINKLLKTFIKYWKKQTQTRKDNATFKKKNYYVRSSFHRNLQKK